jgi:D-beta-D-heptose 7-phosphate kinase / D-beta-D-heptose 1-phosphate adenosyltransferase
MDLNQTITLLRNLNDTKVLCIGDSMLDENIDGTIPRISPEAPIPVFHITDKTITLGGAANVVNNLCRMGINTTFITCLSDDKTGTIIKEKLAELTKVSSIIINDHKKCSTLKTRYRVGHQQILRVDSEDPTTISPQIEKDIKQQLEQLVLIHDIILVSDYNKGMLTPEICQFIIKEANKNNKKVIIDPKGSDYSKYRNAHMLTPNIKELELASGVNIRNNTDLLAAARMILEKFNIDDLIVTKSEKGLHHINNSTDIESPAIEKEVIDVTGAGDTTIATLAILVSKKLPIELVLKIANQAASIVVSKKGTATASIQELVGQLLNETEQNFYNLEQLLMRVEALREQNPSINIGFTNGCFDIIHNGHVKMLSKTRKECDYLIVGINSDRSVKQLKGKTRPIQDELTRANIIWHLASTDNVIIFDELTPLELIKAIKPSTIFKGKDYKENEVVGEDVVKSYGGKVILIDLEAGHSTTNIINKINNNNTL